MGTVEQDQVLIILKVIPKGLPIHEALRLQLLDTDCSTSLAIFRTQLRW